MQVIGTPAWNDSFCWQLRHPTDEGGSHERSGVRYPGHWQAGRKGRQRHQRFCVQGEANGCGTSFTSVSFGKEEKNLLFLFHVMLVMLLRTAPWIVCAYTYTDISHLFFILFFSCYVGYASMNSTAECMCAHTHTHMTYMCHLHFFWRKISCHVLFKSDVVKIYLQLFERDKICSTRCKLLIWNILLF